MEILNVENLTFTYPECNTPTIKGVNFSVKEGEFLVLCGETGCGKSTLLKNLKREIAPLGIRSGNIRIFGEEIDFEEENDSNSVRIGFVCQNPKQQAVTDKVWHELAFGLENMNVPREKMSARVAEMASYFGIEDWFDKKVEDLSGGQLQILNLASVMVMNPDILILDEPSSQLDPVSASGFFSTLKKLNSELSVTVIIAEHRLEELIPFCDRMIVMKKGTVSLEGRPCDILERIGRDDEIFDALPVSYRFYREMSEKGWTEDKCHENRIPLSIREGRGFLRSVTDGKEIVCPNEDEDKKPEIVGKGLTPALEFKEVSFRYSKEDPDALSDISFSVDQGEIFFLLGGNASGKTTALNVAAGLLRPYEGYIKVFGKKIKEYKNQSLYNKCLSMLHQDVQTLFLHNTVEEELRSRKAFEKLKDLPFDLEHLLGKHPYDLSGGEQQLLALAIVLAAEPRIILLDEPTKGLDAYRKKILAGILKKLKSLGMTIVAVTHDVEFAAECADKCALIFRGNIASQNKTTEFLKDIKFYTTPVCRMSKGILDGAITVENLVKKIRGIRTKAYAGDKK